ncbi:MAG: TonB-dependent receptor [Xanthomonadales bacterium]|nr:TonB-dependent receptor [Xanthomonadales bacterium]
MVSALRDTPEDEFSAGVTTLDGETIRAAALAHAEELVSMVPNMNRSGEGSRARYFQLRGIGELEQYEGAPNPSVGFIVDDIDLSGVGGITNLFDVQRVEVLRGPQPTRFGANAIGGLVYVQSAEPGAAPGFEARVQLGSDATRSVALAWDADLGPARGRFSAQQFQNDGFYDNVSQGRDDTNERDETALRGRIEWDVGAAWTGRLNLLWADFNNGYDAWAPDNGRTTYSDNPGRDEQRTAGAALRFEGPLASGVDLVSITSMADSRILFSYDGEWGDETYWAPYIYDYTYEDRRRRQASGQEFRLVSTPSTAFANGRGDWVIGLYAQRLEESNDIISAGIYDDSVDAPLAFCTPCRADSRLFSDYASTNTAVFAQLDLQASERTVFSAGVRVERWQARYHDRFEDRVYGAPGAFQTNRFEPADTLWGGELSVSREMGEGYRGWLRLARGYKAGGFNPSFARVAAASNLGTDSIAFAPESLLSFEAGFQGRWLSDRLDAGVSLFRMERNEMQLRSSAQFTDNPNDFIFITSNAAGRSQGLEAEFDLVLVRDWSLAGSVGWLDTEIESYGLSREAGIAGSLVGRDFAHAPSWTSQLSLQWRPDTGAGWHARVDWQAMDGFYFDYSHDEKAARRSLVHMRLGRDFGDWSLALWVRNLLDEPYHTRGFSFGLVPPYFERQRFTRLGDPRHYGLTLSYRR